jgi:two-component system cell cycle sensor histidine kinase/response regulator CckA
MVTAPNEAAMGRLLDELTGSDGASRLVRQAERAGGVGTFGWDATTHRIELSENALSLLGLPSSPRATVASLWSRVHAPDRARLGGGTLPHRLPAPPLEIRVERERDQGALHLRIDWEEVQSPEGTLLGALGTVVDTTERSSLREVLRESQALWRSIGMNRMDFVSLVDRRGVYVWVNHTAPGIREEDLIGKATLFDLIAPENHPEVRDALDRCFDAALPAYFEAYSPALGAWFSSALGAVVRDGHTSLVSVLTRNITEAKRTVAELGRRERMLAKAQRIAGVGSWEWRARDDGVEWSAEMYRICGVDPAVTATTELFHDVVHPDDRPRMVAAWRRALAKTAVARQEFRIRRVSDGTTRYVLTTGEPTLNDDGAVVGYLGTTLDVTERRELEADLVQSRKLEAVGRLAGGIAHDFNNVLTAILGNAELASHEIAADTPAAASLEVIRQAGERATSLTRQLLAFARRQIVAPRVCAPNALIESVAALFRPLLGDAIRLELALPADIGRIRVDVGQFEQLLMNLAVNARDAMPDGGTLRIETENVTVNEGVLPHPEVTPGDYVALIVSDTGLGIPPEVRAHVFEPFFSTKPSGVGTGLGLATCHGIVKQSGGHIWLESSTGTGTRAFAYLPRAIAEATVDLVSPAVLKTGRETILVVEDERMVRGLVVRSLGALGYEVLEAATGNGAIAVAAAHPQPIHLLFADVMLPDRRGPEVAAALATSHPEAKVLYTSGYTDDDVVTGGVVTASVRLLHKPYTMSALASAVRAALDDTRTGDSDARSTPPPS